MNLENTNATICPNCGKFYCFIIISDDNLFSAQALTSNNFYLCELLLRWFSGKVMHRF